MIARLIAALVRFRATRARDRALVDALTTKPPRMFQ